MEETEEYIDNPRRNKDVDDVKLWCRALKITPSQFFQMPEEELKLRLNNLKGRLRLKVAKNLIAYQKEKLEEMERRNYMLDPSQQWQKNTKAQRIRGGEGSRARAGANIWDILCQAADDVEAMYEGSGSTFSDTGSGGFSDEGACPNYADDYSEDYGTYGSGGSFPLDATGSSAGDATYGIRGFEDFGPPQAAGTYGDFAPCPILQSTPQAPVLSRPVIRSGSVFTSRQSQDSMEMTDYNVVVEDSPQQNVTRITSKTFLTGNPQGTFDVGPTPSRRAAPPSRRGICPAATPSPRACPPVTRTFNVSKKPCPDATFDVGQGPSNRTYKVKCPAKPKASGTCPPQNRTYNVCSPTPAACPSPPRRLMADRTFDASPACPAPAANRTFVTGGSPASAANRTFTASPACPPTNRTFTASPACPPPAANRTFAASPACPPTNRTFTASAGCPAPAANRTFTSSPACPPTNRTFTASPACPPPAANRTFTSSPACPPTNRTFNASPGCPAPSANRTFSASPPCPGPSANRTFNASPAANRTFSASPGCPSPAANRTFEAAENVTNRTFSASPGCPAPAANRTFNASPQAANRTFDASPGRRGRNYRQCP